MLLSMRELLVAQRTQLVNALRGHAAEFGLVSGLGNKGLTQVLADIAQDTELPEPVREALSLLGREIDRNTVIQHAKSGKSSAWLMALLARRPRKLAL